MKGRLKIFLLIWEFRKIYIYNNYPLLLPQLLPDPLISLLLPNFTPSFFSFNNASILICAIHIFLGRRPSTGVWTAGWELYIHLKKTSPPSQMLSVLRSVSVWDGAQSPSHVTPECWVGWTYADNHSSSWVHGCSGPVMSTRHCFTPVFSDHCLLQSISPLFH